MHPRLSSESCMFEQLQNARWYRRRPQNSGFFCVAMLLILLGIYPWLVQIVNRKAKVVGTLTDLSRQQQRYNNGKRAPEIEIVPPPQFISRSSKPKQSPMRCRCHIDTQAPGQPIVHHRTQFPICDHIDNDDKEWAPGFYSGEDVRIRWHCGEH